MRDGTSDVFGKIERVTTRDEHMQVGVFLHELADIALYFKTRTIHRRRKHVSTGIMPQDGGLFLRFYLRKKCRVFVHGVKPQLHTWRDGTTEQTTISREEVISDTSAGIDDE